MLEHQGNTSAKACYLELVLEKQLEAHAGSALTSHFNLYIVRFLRQHAAQSDSQYDTNAAYHDA